MGLNWFKRIYVTSTNWENTMDIKVRPDGDFVIHPDGRTFSVVDLGQLGGLTDATADIKGNTL